MTTLLAAFGLYNLTDAARSRIGRALDEAGLVVEPPMAVVQRAGSVRLSSRNPITHDEPETAGALPHGVSLWRWPAGVAVAAVPADVAAATPVFVDVVVGHADGDRLRDALLKLLPDLPPEAIDDLLQADVEASFKRTHASGGPRLASVYMALPSHDQARQVPSVEVRRALVELAVTPNCLLVVRHTAEIEVDGASTGDADVPVPEAYIAELQALGLAGAADPLEAAMIVLEHAVNSFGVLEADLASRLDFWRLTFARKPSPERGLLVGLQASLPNVTQALQPLRHPSALAWAGFEQEREAKHVRDQVERTLEALQALGGAAASALSLVDQLRAERYQERLATLAAVLLAPGLVAAVFGSNANLQDDWLDLLVLLLAMPGTAILSYLGISRLFRAAD
ncbi:hypothetical protein [Geodermatophilus telluris]|uniref:hypothetical protein n=1 Tax=Geodermatophilus telluris TaxID=1190417 RepID=UPI000B81F95C|nr:hypothetical protein [Geodermatophilus telluris]